MRRRSCCSAQRPPSRSRGVELQKSVRCRSNCKPPARATVPAVSMATSIDGLDFLLNGISSWSDHRFAAGNYDVAGPMTAHVGQYGAKRHIPAFRSPRGDGVSHHVQRRSHPAVRTNTDGNTRKNAVVGSSRRSLKFSWCVGDGIGQASVRKNLSSVTNRKSHAPQALPHCPDRNNCA